MSNQKEAQPTITTSTPGQASKIVAEKYTDVTLRLIEEHGDEFGPLTPEKEQKLRRKLYIHVLSLVLVINLLLFVSMTSEDGFALLM